MSACDHADAGMCSFCARGIMSELAELRACLDSIRKTLAPLNLNQERLDAAVMVVVSRLGNADYMLRKALDEVKRLRLMAGEGQRVLALTEQVESMGRRFMEILELATKGERFAALSQIALIAGNYDSTAGAVINSIGNEMKALRRLEEMARVYGKHDEIYKAVAALDDERWKSK